MSANPSDAQQTPGKGKQAQGSKKILGLPLPVFIAAVAGVAALGWIWWRNHEAAKSATTSASTRTSTSSSTDVSGELDELQAEIDELMGSSGTGTGTGAGGGGTGTTTKTTKTTGTKTTTKTTGTTKPITGTTPNQASVSVPDVEGMRANSAIGVLESKGLSWHGSPTRNPAHEYKVVSQTPAAGKKVAKGSRVDLGFQQIK